MKSYNSHLISLLVLVVFFSVVCPQKSHAALTKQLSYQGRLNNASGQPVANGTYSVVFSIYNVATGGAPLWTETQNVVVEGGGFSAYLGSVTPMTLPFNEDYFLGLKVGSDPEMTPRLKLSVVGASAFSLEAEKLQGKAASDFALATHTHTGLNASTVNSISANTTPTANNLLPLDANAKIPASVIDTTGATNVVTQIIAGANVTISPAGGTGVVTINAVASGGGSPLTPASTVTSITTASIVGTSLNYAREDHQHNMVSNFITDSLVSSSAGIATSKLSGTVTAISGHGLGSLATLNAVSGAEIQDGTILFADIAQNGCASGQVVEWNGTAWNCGTDDVGGGGGIVTNPTSTQTIIAGNATTTPLALKAASAPTAAMFDVQDFSGGSVVKVAPSGNLLVGNPAQIAPKLSVESAGTDPTLAIKHTGSGTALDVWQAGSGMGVVASLPAGNTNPIYEGDTSGTGNLLQLSVGGINKFVVDNTGAITTGGAANTVKTNPSAAQVIAPTADATALVLKPGTATPTLDIFGINNFSDVNLLKVNPSGNLLVGNPTTTTAKVSAEETGTANAGGVFVISNASNMNVAVYGETYGSGAGVLGVTNGTGKAIHGVVYGTSGQGGLFEIQNATNAQAAVYGITGGTGYAGNFELNNASNSQPALRVSTGGIGSAGVFLIGNASNSASLIFGNNSLGTGNLLQLQQNSVNKFVVGNTGDVIISKAGTSLIDVKDVGNTVLNITNSDAAGTASLQVEGANVLTSANGIITNPSAAQTILPTADVVPLAIKDDAGSVANLLEVKNNAGANLLYVNPAGRLMVGAPTTIALVSSENQNTGVIEAGRFIINNSTNSANALTAEVTTGTGQAGQFTIASGTNSSPVLVANTTGTGDLLNLRQLGSNKLVVNNAGNLLVGSPIQTGPKVSVETTTNQAGRFAINNTTNGFDALYVATNGTGVAGDFQINNGTNPSSIIKGNTTGTGNLLQLQKSGVDKFVVDNTGAITVGGAANTVKTNPSAAQTIAPTADATALVLKPGTAAPTLDIFGINNFADVNLLKVGPTGNLLVGNPVATAAKVSAYETGTANHAGYFEISNATNANDAVYGTTTGTGYAGNFYIVNAGSSTSVIIGNTTGTGNLLQLQKSSVNKFVVDNAGNTLIGNPALTTAKVSAEETGTANNAGYFKISNAGNANDAVYGYTTGSGAAIFGYGAGSGNAVYGYVSSTGKAGFFDIQNAVNSASVLEGNTTGTGNLLQLQQSYVNKFVVTNAGSVLLDGNANPSIKASGATPNLIIDADGTGASIVTVKNTTSPGNVMLQVNGNITAFSGTNSVPVTGATQQLIQTGNACEAIVTSGVVTVTFAPAFAATPTVTFGQTGGTAPSPAPSITAKNASSFTVSGFETSATSECIDWIAIGNK